MDAGNFLFAVWLTGLAATLGYLVCVQVLWSYLRQNCPAVWDALGNPSFWNNSPKVGWVFVRWLVRRDYRQIGDEKGIRIAKATEVMFWLAAALIVFIFALGIVTRGGQSWPL